MMSKRIIALLLCLVMCATILIGCGESIKADSDMKGAYITMFLTDEVYNFDPAYAYMNEEAESIISLLFARLFTLDSDGDLQYELAEEYVIKEDEKTKEYTMTITLRDAWWSDKIKLTAEDIVFAWKRILNPENSFACASLLFDLKNARAVKASNCSIDDLGVCALNDNTLQIKFEKPIDYEKFLLNLTSLALAPLREDYVTKGDDWAKKPGTMVTSGPFKLSKIKFVEDGTIKYSDINGTSETGVPYTSPHNEEKATYSILVLERNACYKRDPNEKDLDLNESVEPYRIIVYCAKTDEQLLAAFRGGVVDFIDLDNDPRTKDDQYDVCGDIFYMGKIPLSLRHEADLMDEAKITDALSTMSFYLNETAQVKNNTTGESIALFANADVRRALSLALDRTAVANKLVLAKPATGLVPDGIFNKDEDESFREKGGNLLSTGANASEASQLLTNAGITPSDYSFSILVNANDDDHLALAEIAKTAWSNLGFNVSVEERGTILNNDYYVHTDSLPIDICDDLFAESIQNGTFTVAIIDYCAYTAEAYSMLAPFAADFSGMVDKEFNMMPHITGYNSESYNALMEAIYFLPYRTQISAEDYALFVNYASAEEFQQVLDTIDAVYATYGIDTSKVAEGKLTLLHKAEEMLMQDMPIIPVVFNQNASVMSKSLNKVENDLYVSYKFEKTTLDDYKNYLDDFAHIVSQKYPETQKPKK